ncbi:MAG TPA: polysaccharide deacetylase family protein [Tepidisphaeraceae bacterium]|nr:polysaccharide deacetylase family protein [Tepidisphaeraceae bacterium]
MNASTKSLLVGGAGALLGVGAYATFVPQSGVWGPVIYRGTSDDPPRVALTFDDGPTAGATDRVLDILGELDVKAAFFVIGRNVEREPQLLARMAAQGHLIGNHSYDHSRWGIFGQYRYWREQIARTDTAIERVLGQKSTMFRPPMGQKTPHIMSAARQTGHAVVTWNVRGWDGLATTTPRILRRILPQCRPGSIILLHDGTEPGRRRDASPTIAAIKPLVLELRARGLEVGSLAEMMKAGKA